MTTTSGTLPGMSGEGSAAYKTRIIACKCNDEGVCIMCADCGHIFVPSVPLSDESEAILNTDLSRALFYHMCTMPRAHPRRVVTGARKPQRRR
jgi:hypothetical protein